jgi:hypothetical protein
VMFLAFGHNLWASLFSGSSAIVMTITTRW